MSKDISPYIISCALIHDLVLCAAKLPENTSEYTWLLYLAIDDFPVT